MAEIPTTQRAYTLRLRGANKEDQSWREALWATHEAVNQGAKAFGDWLLTLRGGIDHQLADERPERRPLLALSWLSVESAPKSGDEHEKYAIADSKAEVIAVLRDILLQRGVNGKELESWVADCTPSLAAEIRSDARWVNRSKAFDSARQRVGKSLTREEVWDILEPFFGSADAYFEPVKTGDDDENTTGGIDEKAKDLVQKAGGWLSSRFGVGKGADFDRMAKVYETMSVWAEKSRAFRSGSSALESLAKALQRFEPQSNDADGI
ncbi:MAG: type V CRISPR-associated protein Cas12b, partial [Acidobacteriales bacterium]|nr:type V CRISPR-associated protein Cas12b [Terriglobales bacterium]